MARETPPLPKVIADRDATLTAITVVGGVLALLTTLVFGASGLLSLGVCMPAGMACFVVLSLFERLCIPYALIRRAKEFDGRVCTACAHPLMPDADGRITCSECGTIQTVTESVASWKEYLQMRGMLDRESGPVRSTTERLAAFAALATGIFYLLLSLAVVLFIVWILLDGRFSQASLSSTLHLLGVPLGFLIGVAAAVGVAFAISRRGRPPEQ